MDSYKYVKCNGKVRETIEGDVIVDSEYACTDDAGFTPAPIPDIDEIVTGNPSIQEDVVTPEAQTTNAPVEHIPVKLYNEVQTDTTVSKKFRMP